MSLMHRTSGPISSPSKRFARLYPKGEVRHAGKASTHPAVFRLAADVGVGMDVASPDETRCALDAGVPPERLDVNGNAKARG
jgi:diaminopimelate decarboxylase